MFRTLCLSAALALVSLQTRAEVVDFDTGYGVLSFEKGTGNISTGKSSEISVSADHAKLGNNSLLWEWSKRNATLEIRENIPYLHENPNPKETSVSTFVFWVYSPEALDGSLRFTFMKGERECCHFDYGLGFTGWRGAWVAFDRDMTGRPEEGMDRIVISAPEEVKNGRLYFDGIITSSFQDVRHHTPDWQAPFINKETTSHWLVLNNSWNLRLDIPVNDGISEKSVQDMDTVENRFVRLVTDSRKPWTYDKVLEVYDSYGISFNTDGTINGKPVFFTRYGETFINLGIPDASKQFGKCGQLLRAANDNLFNMAVTWMHETDSVRKAGIAEMYVNLTKHLLDQGFAAGSAQGTLHHLGYSMRNFYTAPVIMKDVLKKAGIAAEVQQAMEWFSGVGEVKTAPAEPGMDIDAFNTSLMGRVASLLMMDDTPYKEAYMKALSRWIDNGFKYADGTKPCFKRDGSVFHHRKAYPAYAIGGFDGAVNSVWMLAGTEFAISEESHNILKDALLEMRFYCNRLSFPLAMSGRHPDGKGALIPRQYALLADAGSPDGTQETDKELASAYLRLSDRPDSWCRKFEAAGIKAEHAPQGTRVYGYNCSMSHRQDEWLVTFAGHSRYLWSAEIYNGANLYGRYLTHGSMQILADPADNVSAFGSGYAVDGWDWCHIPGTTAAEIPMEDMLANVLNVDEFSGYEEMLLSDEWFAGGVSHKGTSGTFAMILHEHDKYNGSLRGRKSFFAFGNRIIALGSGLENGLAGSELHTTLFQNSLAGETGIKDTTLIYEDTSAMLKDRFGNAFFVKDAKTVYTAGDQSSFHEETMEPTGGRFEKAYICHGGNVKGGHYEYMTVIHATPEEISAYGDELPYEVVRCDSSAHIVRDKTGGISAFALFEGLKDPIDPILAEASPSVIMYSIDDNTLTLSVCNPDLALYEGESDERFDKDGKRIERSVYGREWIDNPCGDVTVDLVLNGEWELENAEGVTLSTVISDGKTEITLSTREGRTEEITLGKILQ